MLITQLTEYTIKNSQFIGFIIFFILYCLYKKRINDSLIKNIDYIIIFIILSILYPLENSTENIGILLGIGAFWYGFSQFKINKQYEIIAKFNDNRKNSTNFAEAFNNLLDNSQILSSLIDTEKNKMILLNRRMGDILHEWSKGVNLDEIKELIEKDILRVKELDFVTKSFRLSIKEKETLIKELNNDEIKNKIKNEIDMLEILIKSINDAYDQTFKKECKCEKIKRNIIRLLRP